MKTALTRSQAWNVVFVALAGAVYLVLTFTAPRAENPNPYHLSLLAILVLTVTIVGLWMLTCWFGFYSWYRLDTYARMLERGAGRRSYEQIAQGVRVLAYGLLVSSILSASYPFLVHHPGWNAMARQVNYYLVVIFPFLGFLYLRMGTKGLAVSAQAAMSLRMRLVTVGPPVVLLASFYVFLVATDPSPGASSLAFGPLGFFVLPVTVLLVVGSWALGWLAALNIERATHGGGTAAQTRPLVKLYNGILTMTGGFIILDALLSLGTTRLQTLPISLVVLLLYTFIGVVALGFMLVSVGARALIESAPRRAG